MHRVDEVERAYAPAHAGTEACRPVVKAAAEAERKKAMLAMADHFEVSVMRLVKEVSAQSTELQATAQGMATGAKQASAREATANVQTVASATEELSSSISDISRHVSEAAKVSTQASEETSRANTMVEGLARRVIADWHRRYNEDRPHSALDDQTPAAFAAKRSATMISTQRLTL